MKFNFVRTLVITGLAAGGLVTGVAAASAAPMSAAPTTTISEIPTCVLLAQTDYIRDGQTRSLANAKNNCSYTVRLRMIWAHTTDGACFGLAPGQDHGESKPGYGPYVSELRSC